MVRLGLLQYSSVRKDWHFLSTFQRSLWGESSCRHGSNLISTALHNLQFTHWFIVPAVSCVSPYWNLFTIYKFIFSYRSRRAESSKTSVDRKANCCSKSLTILCGITNESTTRSHTKGVDAGSDLRDAADAVGRICLKHYFSWNVCFTRESENAQPCQHLKLSKSCDDTE